MFQCNSSSERAARGCYLKSKCRLIIFLSQDTCIQNFERYKRTVKNSKIIVEKVQLIIWSVPDCIITSALLPLYNHGSDLQTCSDKLVSRASQQNDYPPRAYANIGLVENHFLCNEFFVRFIVV